MKIKQASYVGGRASNNETSIANAVSGTIEEAGSDDGQMERIGSRTNKAAEILGQLIQALHENGNLRDEQVASMLGFRYTVED